MSINSEIHKTGSPLRQQVSQSQETITRAHEQGSRVREQEKAEQCDQDRLSRCEKISAEIAIQLVTSEKLGICRGPPPALQFHLCLGCAGSLRPFNRQGINRRWVQEEEKGRK